MGVGHNAVEIGWVHVLLRGFEHAPDARSFLVLLFRSDGFVD